MASHHNVKNLVLYDRRVFSYRSFGLKLLKQSKLSITNNAICKYFLRVTIGLPTIRSKIQTNEYRIYKNKYYRVSCKALNMHASLGKNVKDTSVMIVFRQFEPPTAT